MDTPVTLQHPLLGELVWDDDLGWWERDAFPLPMFGGAEVSLTLTPDETWAGPAQIPDDVTAAVKAFLALGPDALSAIAPHLWGNYREIADLFMDDNFLKIGEGEDIRSFVEPGNVAFERRDKDGFVYVSMECNVEWEQEHGLQLVLQRGERWVKVSNYNGHLTDGDAYAKPVLDAWMADPTASLPVRTMAEKRA